MADLHTRLGTTQPGTEQHIELQSKIAVLKDSMAAHAELFRRLKDAHDRERMFEIVEMRRILEKRFSNEIKTLLELDLTFTELNRLNRFIGQIYGNVDGTSRSSRASRN